MCLAQESTSLLDSFKLICRNVQAQPHPLLEVEITFLHLRYSDEKKF